MKTDQRHKYHLELANIFQQIWNRDTSVKSLNITILDDIIVEDAYIPCFFLNAFEWHELF